MRWYIGVKPRGGETRERVRFAWWPTCIGGGYLIWLERYRVHEEYRYWHEGWDWVSGWVETARYYPHTFRGRS